MLRLFILKTLIFSTLIFIFILLLANIKLTDEYIIYKTEKTDYTKIAWNLRLLKTNPERLNGAVVYLGPSLVQGGISDTLLNNNGVPAINMAVNHPGKEIEYYFLKRIVPFNPSKVYLFGNYEIHTSHPMAALLFSPSEYIVAGQFFNTYFFGFLAQRVMFVTDFLKWQVLSNTSNSMENPSNQFGEILHENPITLDYYESQLKIVDTPIKLGIASRLKSLIKPLLKGNPLYEDLLVNTGSQHRFLLNSIKISEANNLSISALYIPVFSDLSLTNPIIKDNYFAATKLKLQKMESYQVLRSQKYWVDLNHLSKAGAELFSTLLLEKQD